MISSSALAGAERHTLDLCEALSRRGARVALICPKGGWLPLEAKQSRLDAHEMDFLAADFPTQLRDLAQANQTQLIHTHLTRAAYEGEALSKELGVPLVSTVHIRNEDEVFARLGQQGHTLIAVSEFVRDMLERQGVPHQSIRLIYNGTNLHRLPTSETRPADGRIVMVCVGRLAEEKGTFDLLEALGELKHEFPSLDLWFLGAMSQEGEANIRQLIQKLDLENRVLILGQHVDVARVLGAADLCVFPSHMETFGLAALEAMARAKPVLITRVGGLNELITDSKEGITIEFGVPNLVVGLRRMLAEREHWEQWGRAAQQRVRDHFDLEQMVDAVLAVYEEILSR